MNPRVLLFVSLFAWSFAGAAPSVSPVAVGPVDLATAYLTNPLGVDEPAPRLTWTLPAHGLLLEQSAYRILVASAPDKLARGEGDLWDSGKVPGQTAAALYAGRPLPSRLRCHWKVMAWDRDDRASAWSEAAWWEMGLTDPADWQARWIRHPAFTDELKASLPAPYFRRSFRLKAAPVRARAYVTGLGYFELSANGRKVGDHLLAPVMTRYDRRVAYLTFDLANRLHPGENTLGLVLGTGWYNHFARTVWRFDQAPWRSYPEALCQLEVTYADGTTELITTGEDWKAAQGPIRFDGLFNGETYDARLEIPGWDRAGFDDRDWHPAVVSTGPAGRLSARLIEPIRATAEIRPVSMREAAPGVWLFDLGQNIAGFCRLEVAGPAGTEISLAMGETLRTDGLIDRTQLQRFLRTGQAQIDHYTLKGGGTETWQPRFVYHGFQFVEVRGLPSPPTLATITGIVVHTDLERAGSFTSSDPVLNQLQRNMEWSFTGNYHGLPTDCPHREKLGWTGDAQLVAETGLFYFGVEAAYRKWLDDFLDEQRENGDLPAIIPTSGWGYDRPNERKHPEQGYGPQWDGALVQMTWDLYRFTGDTSILARYAPAIGRYLAFLQTLAPDHTLFFGIDDHKPVRTRTPADIISSAYLAHYRRLYARMARILGETATADAFEVQADLARDAFNRKYYDPSTRRYGNGGQTSQAMALYFDLVPSADRAAVLSGLLDDIRRGGDRFDVGVVGLKFLFNVLRQAGESELLHRMVSHRDVPGFGYWVERGATTLWQDWDGSMSRNHIMFGTVNEWFFEGLAGIQLDDDRPGFRHFIVRPDPIPQLTSAAATHQAPDGEVAVSWEKQGSNLHLHVTVPPNSTATTWLPPRYRRTATLNGGSVTDPAGSIHLGPGRHHLIADGDR